MTTPTQIRTVDPYENYETDPIRRFSEMVNNGQDGLYKPNPIIVSTVNTTTLRASDGRCYKDNALIDISQIDIDITLASAYEDTVTHNTEGGYHYCVLEYSYERIIPAPSAVIKLIAPSQISGDYSTATQILLKVVEMSSGLIDDLHDYDPSDSSIQVPFNEVINKRVVDTSTSNYNISIFDKVIFANTPIIYLHPAVMKGEHTIINNRSSGSLAVSVNLDTSSDMIETETMISLAKQYDSVTLSSNGSTLWIEI